MATAGSHSSGSIHRLPDAVIRIILLGRTGNNLFQYALGRVLAAKHGVPLVLDGSWFNAEGWREVSHFLKLPLKAKVVRRCSLASRALRKLTGKHYWEYGNFPIVMERPDDQSFDPCFLNAPANCLLYGYFQSPLYFREIASELRGELNSLFDAVSYDRAGIVARLKDPLSVVVHVRRQDYLHQPIFNVCDDGYYHESIRRMRASLPGARFFIFSDDPSWCRTEFRAKDQEVVGTDGELSNPLQDLHLMSLASHHIIANSTYSWWAAWLGEKNGQQVLMPDRWYAQGIKAPVEEKRLAHWQIVQRSSAVAF